MFDRPRAVTNQQQMRERNQPAHRTRLKRFVCAHPMPIPILSNKHYEEPSVFTAQNLLREARRQKGLAPVNVPPVCILDPDGDLGRLLLATRCARVSQDWACYHTELLLFEQEGLSLGLVRYAVGAPFAVLVAEELSAAGCRLLISMTSAGGV